MKFKPEWKWVARDEDGPWYAYDNEPVKVDGDGWSPGWDLKSMSDSALFLHQHKYNLPDIPWEDSLRPIVDGDIQWNEGDLG